MSRKGRKPIKAETIRRNTIEDMKVLQTYKQEYIPIIDIYSELREQYERLTQKFKESNYLTFEITGKGGTKKAPLLATLESLRKDILAYSDRLCLNPKTYDSLDIKIPKKSKLEQALSELNS